MYFLGERSEARVPHSSPDPLPEAATHRQFPEQFPGVEPLVGAARCTFNILTSLTFTGVKDYLLTSSIS